MGKNSLCRCVCVTWNCEWRCTWLVIVTFVLGLSSANAQQLLDRIVAHVDGYAITLTDVKAVMELGVIDAPDGADREAVAVQRLIDRQLVLAEVARFVPPEPDVAAVDREVAVMKTHAGARFTAVVESTGVDDVRILEIARDTLRIQAYLNQRFGRTVQVSTEDVAQYYRIHPEEFMRDGAPISFDEAEPAARQRAASERRVSMITQWMRDLRARAEVIETRQ